MSAREFYNAPQGGGGGGGGYGYGNNGGGGGGFAPPPNPPPNAYNQQFGQYPNTNQSQGGYYPPPQPPPNMKPSASYAPPPGPPQQGWQQPQQPPNNGGAAEYGADKPYDGAPFSQATADTGPRFRPRKRVNDIIPLVLFIAAVVGFAVLSGIAIKTFVQYNGLSGGFGNGTQGGTGSAVTLN